MKSLIISLAVFFVSLIILSVIGDNASFSSDGGLFAAFTLISFQNAVILALVIQLFQNKQQTKQDKFQTRYFYIKSNDGEERFLSWDTVQGLVDKQTKQDYGAVTELMIQDIQETYGHDYQVCELKKEEFVNQKRPTD